MQQTNINWSTAVDPGELKILLDIQELLGKMDVMRLRERGVLGCDQLYPTSVGHDGKQRYRLDRSTSTTRRPHRTSSRHARQRKQEAIQTSNNGSASADGLRKEKKKQKKNQDFSRSDFTRCSLTTHTGTHSSSGLSTSHSPPNRSKQNLPESNIPKLNISERKRSVKATSKKIYDERSAVSDSESGFHSEGMASPTVGVVFPLMCVASPIVGMLSTEGKLTRDSSEIEGDRITDVTHITPGKFYSSDSNIRTNAFKQSLAQPATLASNYENLNFYESLVTEALKVDNNDSAAAQEAPHVSGTCYKDEHCVDACGRECVEAEHPAPRMSLFSCSTSSPLYFGRPKFKLRRAHKSY